MRISPYGFGMVKRKVETNLDEWLERGALCAEATRIRIAAATVKETPEPIPTVVEAPDSEEAIVSPTIPADVAELDNTEWLWALLEQAGYERW